MLRRNRRTRLRERDSEASVEGGGGKGRTWERTPGFVFGGGGAGLVQAQIALVKVSLPCEMGMRGLASPSLCPQELRVSVQRR